MRRRPNSHYSSRWTGESEPVEAEALMLVLVAGAILFLIVGLATL